MEDGLGLTPTSRDGVFATSTTVEISLRLENLPAGSYRIRDTILNQEHGSCVDQWRKMGGEKLGAKEPELLRRKSSPARHVSVAEADQGILQYDASLAPHEVRLVELCPAEEGYYA